MLGQFILTIAALVFSGLVSSGKTGRANIGAFALKPVPEDFFGALSGAAERRPDLNVRFCLRAKRKNLVSVAAFGRKTHTGFTPQRLKWGYRFGSLCRGQVKTEN